MVKIKILILVVAGIVFIHGKKGGCGRGRTDGKDCPVSPSQYTECTSSSYDCDHDCFKDGSKQFCACSVGYYLHNDQKTCIPVTFCPSGFVMDKLGQCYVLHTTGTPGTYKDAAQYCSKHTSTILDTTSWTDEQKDSLQLYASENVASSECSRYFAERIDPSSRKSAQMLQKTGSDWELVTVELDSNPGCAACQDVDTACEVPMLIDEFEDTSNDYLKTQSASTRELITEITTPAYSASQTRNGFVTLKTVFVKSTYLTSFLHLGNNKLGGGGFKIAYKQNSSASFQYVMDEDSSPKIFPFHISDTSFIKHVFRPALKASQVKIEYSNTHSKPLDTLVFDFFGCETDGVDDTVSLQVYASDSEVEYESPGIDINFLILVPEDTDHVWVKLQLENNIQYTVNWFYSFPPASSLLADFGLDGVVIESDLENKKGFIMPHKFTSAGVYRVKATVGRFVSEMTQTVNVYVACQPSLVMSTLSNNPNNPVSFRTSYEITLNGVFEGCSTRLVTGATWNWIITRVETGSDDVTVTLPDSVSVTASRLVIPADTLETASYCVAVTSTAQLTLPSTSTQFSYKGYMKVVAAPINVALSGGTLRVISYTTPLTLKAVVQNDLGKSVADNLLSFTWYCSQNQGETCTFATAHPAIIPGTTRLSLTDSSISLANGTLTPASEYVFSVHANQTSGSTSAIATQTVRVLSTPVPELAIMCLLNCGSSLKFVSATEKLALNVRCHSCSSGQVLQYMWTFSPGSYVATKQSLDWEAETSTGQQRQSLVIRPNVLRLSEVYVITVTGTDQFGVSGYAEVGVEVASAPVAGVCQADPSSGYALSTEFTVSCTGFSAGLAGPLTYMFYLLSEDERSNKRLLSQGQQGTSSVLLLAQATTADNTHTIQVIVQNVYGVSVSTSVSIQVLPLSADQSSYTDATFGVPLGLIIEVEGTSEGSALSRQLAANNVNGAVSLIGAVASTLNSDQQQDVAAKQTKIQFRDAMMAAISNITAIITDIGMVQQLSQVASDVLSNPDELSDTAQEKAISSYESLGSKYTELAADTSSAQAHDAAGSLFGGVSGLLQMSAVSQRTLNITDRASSALDRAKRMSAAANSVINAVVSSLVDYLAPQEGPVTFSRSSITIQLEKSYLHSLAGKSVSKQKLSGSSSQSSGEDWRIWQPAGSVKMPDLHTFQQALSRCALASIDESISIQSVLSKYNPYGWDETAGDVATPVYNVNLRSENKSEVKLHNLSTPVAISLSVQESLSKSNTDRLQNSSQNAHLEFVYEPATGQAITDHNRVTIITLTMSQNQPTIIGLYPSLTDINVQVLLKPKYSLNDTVTSEEIEAHGVDLGNVTGVTLEISNITASVLVSARNTLLVHPDMSNNETYLLGVLPSPGHVVDVSRIDIAHEPQCHGSGCVAYQVLLNMTVKIGAGGCLYWNETNEMWDSSGCEPSPSSSAHELICLCTHMTAFSGSFLVMPNSVSLSDIYLFATFFENPVVVSTVTAVWFIYVVLVLWARRKDIRDAQQSGVTVICNNEADQHYTYLVCVVTGWWRNSGTTSNVYCLFHGTRGTSDKYVLFDENRLRFQTASEDCFLVNTPKSLGILKSLSIWTDNTGSKPSWFLKEVIIKDIQTERTWTFLYNDWLELSSTRVKTMAKLPAKSTTQMTRNRRYQFMFKSTSDMRSGHLWFSIFTKPVHCQFTRVQRLSCALTLLLTAMLTNIMFFGIPTDDPEDQIGDAKIVISISALVIGVETALIMFPINFLVIQLFTRVKSRPDKNKKVRYETSMNENELENSNDVYSSATDVIAPSSRFERLYRLLPSRFKYTTFSMQNSPKNTDNAPKSCEIPIETVSTDTGMSSSNRPRFKFNWTKLKPVRLTNFIRSHKIRKTDSLSVQEKELIVFNNLNVQNIEIPGTSTSGGINVSPAAVYIEVTETDSLTFNPVNNNDGTLNVNSDSKDTGTLDTFLSCSNVTFLSIYDRMDSVRWDDKEEKTATVDDDDDGGEDDDDDDDDEDLENANILLDECLDKLELLGRPPKKIAKEKKSSKGTSSGGSLPWWFLYIAWFVCLAASIICSFFVMLYGLKYGYAKSVEWLVSFFTSFLTSALVTQPLKVFVLAIIITMILHKTVHYEQAQMRLDLDVDEELLQQAHIDKMMLKAHRRQRVKAMPTICKPMSVAMMEGLQKRLQLEWKMQGLIRDLIVYLMFVVIVHIIAYGHRDVTTCFHATKSIEDMFIRGEYFPGPSALTPTFTKVSTVPSMWYYINETFLPMAYAQNQGEQTYARLTADQTSVLVGPARFRQLRVNIDACSDGINQWPIMSRCSATFSYSNEDISDYNQTWQSVIQRPENPLYSGNYWVYQSGWSLNTIPYMGQLALYSGGGYTANIPDEVAEQQSLLNNLMDSDWIDNRTRAIFLEFTVHNPNTNLFSMVVLLFEFSASGAIIPFYQVFPCKLYHYANEFELFVAACEGLFIVYTVMFAYFEIRRVHHLGRKLYLSDPWSYVEFAIIILSFTIIGLFFQRMVAVNSVITRLKMIEKQTFVSFYPAVLADYTLGYVLSALVVIVIIRIIKQLKFNKRMSILATTLKLASGSLQNFMILSMIFIMSFAHFAVLVFGTSMYGYSDMLQSILTLHNFILGVSDFYELLSCSRVLGPLFYFLFILLVLTCLVNMFLSIIIEAFQRTKACVNMCQNEYELIDFIYSRFLLMMGRHVKVKSKKKSETLI